MDQRNRLPAVRGGLLALLAAVLFGLSTPLVQHLGAGVGPFGTAALLYAGAASVGALLRRPPQREAQLRRGDVGLLAAMAFFGAVLAPVALAWGLQNTSGASASLMLTLEAVFTALLARLLYRETLDRRVMLAMALLTAGGMVLVADRSQAGTGQVMGLLAVLLATVAWGVDNSLSRALAARDPGQTVMFKAALGAAATTLLAAGSGESLPDLWPAAGLLAVGATGYGLSLRFYLLAQRAFGAARTGSVFAFAPFVGAAFAFTLGDQGHGIWMLAAALLMTAGVVLHLSEQHEHWHDHQVLAHEHAHSHDDGHHTHTHASGDAGTHSHPHRHEPLGHRHPHVPDDHHAHPH